MKNAVSSDGQEDNEMNNAPQVFKRMRSEANNNTSSHLNNLTNLTNHSINFNNNQASSNFDIANNYENSSAILIDRMFSHLTKETEVMREWVVLERERLRQEIARKKEENDREERREKLFLNTLTKMQESMFNFLSRSPSVKDFNSTNTTNGQIANRNVEQHLNGLNDHLNDHNGDGYDDDMN